MSFTFPRMIRGWLTEIPSWRGRDGTRIPEFGTTARTSHSELASELAFLEVMGGAGTIGDSIGVADSQRLTTAGIIPGARRFIIGTPSTEAAARAPEVTTVLAQRPGLSAETQGRFEDTLNHAVRAGFARALSAATGMADRQGVFRHAEAPAWVAEQRAPAVAEERVAAEEEGVAGVGNRRLVMFLVV